MLNFAASFAQSEIAVTCGTPIPATTLVVHIEPGPIPTFTQSAPLSKRALVASAVATFPAKIVMSGYILLNFSSVFRTPALWPCAVSIDNKSTP